MIYRAGWSHGGVAQPAAFVPECERCADLYGGLWRECRVLEYDNIGGPPLFIVDDTLQPVGAFKLRGAATAIGEQCRLHHGREIRFCAASSGSFGLSVAYVTAALGAEATIFMPQETPAAKRQKIRQYGATIIDSFDSYEEAKTEAMAFASLNTDLVFVDGVSREVLMGNGSLMLDVVKAGTMSRSKIAVIVPLGIGSLAVPSALVLNQLGYDFDLYVSEPLTHCKFVSTMNSAPRPVGGETVAEGAAVHEVPSVIRELLASVTAGGSAVSEEEIRKAIRFLWYTFQLKTEGAGALAVATYLSNIDALKGYSQAWAVVTGRNIDDMLFQNIIDKQDG